MELKTKNGRSIKIDDYVDQIKLNLQLNRYIFEQTPISKKANGNFFWWDEKTNPEIKKSSITNIIKLLKNGITC